MKIHIAKTGDSRDSWAEAFREMARRGDDALIDGDIQWSAGWDAEEWEWE